MTMEKASLLTSLLSLSVGLGIGYWLFSGHSVSAMAPLNASDINAQETNTTSASQRQYLATIAQLNAKITILENTLRQVTASQLKGNPANRIMPPSVSNKSKPTQAPVQNLTKMNLDDFNSMMEKSLINQARSIILQFDQERMENFKMDFEASQEIDQWAAQFQDKLSQFIAENDTLDEIFINSITCKITACRLEVTTANPQYWEQLYLKMSRQSWFQSVTIQESTEYPDSVIYYLLKQGT